MRFTKALIMPITAVFIITACEKAEYVPPKWHVGDWAEYEVKAFAGGLKEYKLRYAITGEENIKGETYYWLEMVGASGESHFVYKMLVPYGYRGVAERMIIKVEDQTALEMPKAEGLADEPPGENRPYLYTKEEVKKGKIDEVKITVPAGEFLTIHAKAKNLHEQEAEVWFARNIPILGIVSQKTASEEMKLTAHGKDAKTAITEEPQKVNLGIFD